MPILTDEEIYDRDLVVMFAPTATDKYRVIMDPVEVDTDKGWVKFIAPEKITNVVEFSKRMDADEFLASGGVAENKPVQVVTTKEATGFVVVVDRDNKILEATDKSLCSPTNALSQNSDN